MNLISSAARLIYPRVLRKLEKNLGCKLIFHYIPERYINGIFSGTMTGTWKRFGLDIVKGLNHWTMGHVASGRSTRFDRKAPEYQSWLGGYTVRLASERMLSPEDHFKLAQADQNGWLRMYGDPTPVTSVEGWQMIDLGTINCGRYEGKLHEFSCTTHSDVGINNKSIHLWFGTHVMATIFNAYNPKLALKARYFKSPHVSKDLSYEILNLKGYIAIFEVTPNIRVVLYGCGVVPSESFTSDTLSVIKDDLLQTMKSCEIVKL